jgi:hypothetical protein
VLRPPLLSSGKCPSLAHVSDVAQTFLCPSGILHLAEFATDIRV